MAKILVYQMWPISWEHGLTDMTKHLDRVKDLGFTHVWVSPLYPSPRADHGYDISDYRAIDPRIGTMRQFDEFVKRAHELDLKVLMDMVLNHTSTEHKWFKTHPEYYIWKKEPVDNWVSLFGGSAWELDEERGEYYCHLFDKAQADLNWFPNENSAINEDLVYEFRQIVKFWMENHGVDGFRLDVPQSINKDFANAMSLEKMLTGEQAMTVIKRVFDKLPKKPFLMMECLDPTFGAIVEQYVAKTPVDYCLNIMLKEERDKSSNDFNSAFNKSVAGPALMLDLESHDSPRFTSRSGMTGKEIARLMFTSKAKAICIYQGQELGLKNPRDLTRDRMIALDAQSKIKLESGVPEEEVRKTSRANARVPLPLEEYDMQNRNKESTLNVYKDYISSWKK
jgi:glycosidase